MTLPSRKGASRDEGERREFDDQVSLAAPNPFYHFGVPCGAMCNAGVGTFAATAQEAHSERLHHACAHQLTNSSASEKHMADK